MLIPNSACVLWLGWGLSPGVTHGRLAAGEEVGPRGRCLGQTEETLFSP
jgi:hypothetical protein